MTATRWGPDPAAPRFGVRAVAGPGDDLHGFLARVGELSQRLDAPVQAVRADRVLSWWHLAMAVEQAERAARDGRMRANDPSVEFLLYAAADRQIHRAMAALGVAADAGRALLVVLRPQDPACLDAGLRAAGFMSASAWPGTPDDRAAAWWAARLAADPADVETALFGAIALLALDKA